MKLSKKASERIKDFFDKNTFGCHHWMNADIVEKFQKEFSNLFINMDTFEVEIEDKK